MHDERDAGKQWVRDVGDSPLLARLLFAGYLLAGAFGGLYGGYLLLHESRHWIGWLIALVIVEPIGFACAVGVMVYVAPDSVFADMLFGAIRRATIAMVLIGVALFVFLAGTFAYVAWYFITAGN